MENAFRRFKSAIFPINPQLLKLKLSYFLIYSGKFWLSCNYWSSYFVHECLRKFSSCNSLVLVVSLHLHHLHPDNWLPTTINSVYMCHGHFHTGTHNYRFIQHQAQQNQIKQECWTNVSWTKTGFVADKLGIYKPIIITAGFLMGFIHLPILWLESAHRTHRAELNETIQLAGGPAALSSVSTTAVPSEYIFPILLLIRILGFIFLDASLTVTTLHYT